MSSNRTVVDVSLAVAGFFEFLLRWLLVGAAILAVLPILFIAVIMEPDLEDIYEFTQPYAWKILRENLARATRETDDLRGLSRRQRRQIAFQRIQLELGERQIELDTRRLNTQSAALDGLQARVLDTSSPPRDRTH
ncbi:MAG TPA: hypothetical protein VLF67_04655 [Candidatus Saccharimonas sp.]|nr:hypothetical protein [Candidatus Saccharimonas sp.]